jgi:hypothetical protein
MINMSLRCLNYVSGVYLFRVSLLLIGQLGLGLFLGVGPCFPMAGGLCKFTGGKRLIQRRLYILLEQYKERVKPIQFFQCTIILHL